MTQIWPIPKRAPLIRIENELDQATKYFAAVAARRGIEPTSCLYTVLDFGGGWRFVVTHPEDIDNHLLEGERAIRVPRVLIAEPVEWDDIPRTITLAERYATKWMVERRYNHIPNLRAEVLE